MSDYAHVAHPLMRIILEDSIRFPAYMDFAVHYTTECYHADLDNDSIPYATMQARMNALADAERCLKHEAYDGCFYHIRRYWDI